jgi:hypothetical protein
MLVCFNICTLCQTSIIEPTYKKFEKFLDIFLEGKKSDYLFIL